MKRYLAFDIGDKRIGVAVSDPFNTYALPSETYWRKNFKEDVAALVKLAKDKGATKIICGLPVNFDGTEAEQTRKTARFIEALRAATTIPVECEDERFTTQMAHDVLISEGMRREKRKNYVDALAAANILDGYLQRMNKENKNMAKREDKAPEQDDEYIEDEDIIELVDDDGKIIKFRLFDVTEYKGEKYAFLSPAEHNEHVPDDEIAVFRYNEAEQILETIEDDAFADEVFAFYKNEDGEEE